MITHLDTSARAHLKLPLRGHDLGVSARDLDAGVQAGLVVGVHDVALHDLSRADAAVVGALGSGEAADGPAVRVAVEVEEGVLLLEPEPGLVVGVLVHQLGRLVARVVLVRRAVGVVALAEGEDVVASGGAEGVGEDGDGSQLGASR
jgi:hypothetical protein